MKQSRTSIRLVAAVLALAFVAATAAVAQPVLTVKNDAVGIGTGNSNAGAKLHVVTSGTPISEPFPGISLILQNNGAASGSSAFFSLIAGNASNSQMAFGDTDNAFAGQLIYQHNSDKYQFRIGGTTYMEVSTAGLSTNTTGGACNPGPCDGVFAPDYEVESIEDHAAYMWENQHLWGVGPTPDDGPINLTTTTAGMLHELEKAHIYIEQLNDTVKQLQQRLDELESN